jgi:hypothetical protein
VTRTPLYIRWPAFLLGTLEAALLLALLYTLLRIALHLIALAAKGLP